jgi:hypothetical protein
MIAMRQGKGGLMTQDSNQTAATVAVCMTPQKIEAWLQEIVDAFHQQDVERLAADWSRVKSLSLYWIHHSR